MIFVVVFMGYLPNDLPNKYSIFFLFFAFDCKIYFQDRAFKGIIKLFWLSAKKLFCIGINDQRGTGNQMGTICCER